MHYCLMIKTTGPAIGRKKLLMVPTTWMNPKGIITDGKKKKKKPQVYRLYDSIDVTFSE